MVWSHKKEQEENCESYEEHSEKIIKTLIVNKKFIFTASADCTIKKWCPASSKLDSEATYVGHTATVTELAMLD